MEARHTSDLSNSIDEACIYYRIFGRETIGKDVVFTQLAWLYKLLEEGIYIRTICIAKEMSYFKNHEMLNNIPNIW